MSINDVTPEQWDSMKWVQSKETGMPNLEQKDEQWRRDNKTKADVSLVCADYVMSAARALTYGADKYAPGNYLNGDGMPHLTVYASLMRHLLAWRDGETNDPESGLAHLDHVGANLNMLIDLINKGKGSDDRF